MELKVVKRMVLVTGIILGLVAILNFNVVLADDYDEDDKYVFSIEPSYEINGMDSSRYETMFTVGKTVDLKSITKLETADHDYEYNSVTGKWEEVGKVIDIVYNKMVVKSSNPAVIDIGIDQNKWDGYTREYLIFKSVGSATIYVDYYYNGKHYKVDTEYYVVGNKENNSNKKTNDVVDNHVTSSTEVNSNDKQVVQNNNDKQISQSNNNQENAQENNNKINEVNNQNSNIGEKNKAQENIGADGENLDREILSEEEENNYVGADGENCYEEDEIEHINENRTIKNEISNSDNKINDEKSNNTNTKIAALIGLVSLCGIAVIAVVFIVKSNKKDKKRIM